MSPVAKIQVLELSLLSSDWPHLRPVHPATSSVDKGFSVWGLDYFRPPSLSLQPEGRINFNLSRELGIQRSGGSKARLEYNCLQKRKRIPSS